LRSWGVKPGGYHYTADAANITTPTSDTTYTANFNLLSVGGGDGLLGTYYNNADFTGTTLTRIDPTINFSWDTTAPAPGFGIDTYSVRWTGQIQALYSQTYTFYTQTNDGIRLWVNNQLIISNWTDHVLTENSGTITLVAGQKYDIRIEFYYNYGGAAMRLLWSSPSTPKIAVPQSQLFATAAPPPPCTYALSPASQTIAAAGGTGTVNVTAGVGCAWTAVSNAAWLTITAGSSGSGAGSVTYSVAVNTGAQRVGTITIADQTFTLTQAANTGPVSNGLLGTYYNNADFTGTTLTRIDPTINFSWGTTAPAPGFGIDTYSVCWTGQIQAQYSQTYTFYTQTNDGIRLWVNNQLIISNWTDHVLTENSGTITLVAGQKYDIRIEFYYNYGGAAMRLLWSSPSTPKAAVPETQLFLSP